MRLAWLIAIATAALARGDTFQAIDSDYFLLNTAPSSIPAIQGLGVFAKTNIPAEQIVCEYRGAILSREEGIKVASDKSVFMEFRDKKYVLVGEGICAMINDCRDVQRPPAVPVVLITTAELLL